MILTEEHSKQKQQNFDTKQPQEQEEIKSEGDLISGDMEKYNQFFKEVTCQRVQYFKDELQRNKIKYNYNYFTSNYLIEIINKTDSYSIVNLSVTFSSFNFDILVLNLNCPSQSQFAQLVPLNNGSNGILYSYKNTETQQQFVIKSLCYKNIIELNHKLTLIKKQQFISKAIIEYCTCKLFSVLKIGPHLYNYLGFDMIIYNDTIEFAMEKCTTDVNTSSKQALKQNLNFMHSLKIIHGDIKPQNIMWSPNYQKPVFIDFGFSLNLDQKPGKKIKTSYFGTFMFSSLQMKSIFGVGEKRYVDLYYNDVFALQKTFQEFEKGITKIVRNYDEPIDEQQQQNQQINEKFSQFLFNTRLKLAIYNRDISMVKRLWSTAVQLEQRRLRQLIKNGKNKIKISSTNFCQQFDQNTFQIFLELKSSKKLKQIIEFIIQNEYLNKEIKERISYLIGQNYRMIVNKLKQNNWILKQKFIHRIKQTSSNDRKKDTFHDIYAFIAIFFRQDISYQAKIEKQNCYRYLIKCIKNQKQQKSQNFWNIFLKYVQNLYTTINEVDEIFQQIQKSLGINTTKTVQMDYSICKRAIVIRDVVLSQFGIDVSKLSSQQAIRMNDKFNQMQMSQFCDQKTVELIFGRNSFIKCGKILQFLIQNRDKIHKAQSQNTNSLMLQLVSLYTDCVVYLNAHNLQKISQSYNNLAQKLFRFQTASKCRFVCKCSLNNIKLNTENKNIAQLVYLNKIFQKNLYNYCFQPESILTNYFFLQIFAKIPHSPVNYVKNDKQIIKNFQVFMRMLNTLRQQNKNYLYLVSTLKLCARNFMNIYSSVPLYQVIQNELINFYKTYENTITLNQVFDLIHLILRQRLQIVKEVGLDDYNNFRITEAPAFEHKQVLEKILMKKRNYWIKILQHPFEQFCLLTQQLRLRYLNNMITIYEFYQCFSYLCQKSKILSHKITTFKVANDLQLSISTLKKVCQQIGGQQIVYFDLLKEFFTFFIRQFQKKLWQFVEKTQNSDENSKKLETLENWLTQQKIKQTSSETRIFMIITQYIKNFSQRYKRNANSLFVYILIEYHIKKITVNQYVDISRFYEQKLRTQVRIFKDYPIRTSMKTLVIYCQFMLKLFVLNNMYSKEQAKAMKFAENFMKIGYYLIENQQSSFFITRFRRMCCYTMIKLIKNNYQFKSVKVSSSLYRKRLLQCLRNSHFYFQRQEFSFIKRDLNSNHQSQQISGKIYGKIYGLIKNKSYKIKEWPLGTLYSSRMLQRVFFAMINKNQEMSYLLK